MAESKLLHEHLCLNRLPVGCLTNNYGHLFAVARIFLVIHHYARFNSHPLHMQQIAGHYHFVEVPVKRLHLIRLHRVQILNHHNKRQGLRNPHPAGLFTGHQFLHLNVIQLLLLYFRIHI